MNHEEKYFQSKNIIFSAYAPAVLCAFIALMITGCLLFIGGRAVNSASSFQMLFNFSMPMCFMYYAFTMHAMIKKVREQQLHIEKLQQQQQQDVNQD